MAETDEAKFELHILKHLLRPSYLSATIAVLTTLVAVGSVIISRVYLSEGWLADTIRTVSASDQQIFSRGTGDGSSPFNVALLFMFWAFVGLAVYFIVIGITQSIKEVKLLEAELNFVHTNRKTIVRDFVIKLLTRFAGLVLTFLMAAIFLKAILPYALTTVEAATFSANDMLKTVLAVSLILVTMHVLAVLLRVVALRPRLFTAEIEA